MQVSKANIKIEHAFSIPLPENLPSSFFYFGESMSNFGVIYELKANLVGLKNSSVGGLPEGTVVFGVKQLVKIRARDPPSKQGITQEQTGETKGMMNSSTGPSTLSGHLPSDVSVQKGDAALVLYANNSQCKKMVK